MASIIAGLNAAPIRRLEVSWTLINTRFMKRLGACEMLIHPDKHFKNYRHMLATISPPCVPYVGEYSSFLSSGTCGT